MANKDNISEHNFPKSLIVLVPNHLGDPQYLQPIKELLREKPEFANAFWYDFCYREPWYSNKNPEVIASDLAAEIKNFYINHKAEIEDIILAGHSMGTAILRRAFLDAKTFSEKEALNQEWANRVKRIILMGAWGRGFDVSRLPVHWKLLVRPLLILSQLFGFGKMRRSIMIGADFISNLRVDWIHFNNCENGSKPQVVHLLGTDDRYINRDDQIDIEQFPEAMRVDVPKATHASVASATSSSYIVRAFQGASEASAANNISCADDIYFLVHGIRSSKRCFEGVKSKVEKLYQCHEDLKGKRTHKTITSTYEYLSLRGFLNTAHRNSFIPWFVDQYTEELARNPNAKFYCAGHSNGTYILGEAFERIHGMKFERIYLAASILPQEYNWEEAIVDGKVTDKVRSDMGSKDWVVGVLAKALRSLGIKQIGPSGYDSFYYGEGQLVENIIPGDHNGMLRNPNDDFKRSKSDSTERTDSPTDSIANFLVFGNPDKLTKQGIKELPRLLEKFGDLLLLLLVFVFIVLLVVGLLLPVLMPLLPVPWWVGPLSALVVGLVVWIILGRF